MDAGKVVLTELDRLLTSDQETGGRPVLPEGSRARVQEELERVLITRRLLVCHIGELQARLGGRLRHWELLPEDLHELVVEEGLRVLDDATLAALALNPLALCALHGMMYALDATLAQAWHEAMRRQTDLELLADPLTRVLKDVGEATRARGWKPGQPDPFGPAPPDQQ